MLDTRRLPDYKLFIHLVVMSAGGGQNPEQAYADFFKNADTVNKQLKLLWISVGKDDFALNGSKALDEALTKNRLAPLSQRHRSEVVQVESARGRAALGELDN